MYCTSARNIRLSGHAPQHLHTPALRTTTKEISINLWNSGWNSSLVNKPIAKLAAPMARSAMARARVRMCGRSSRSVWAPASRTSHVLWNRCSTHSSRPYTIKPTQHLRGIAREFKASSVLHRLSSVDGVGFDYWSDHHKWSVTLCSQ